MKTYFDYDEIERGNMTEEEVQNLTVFALMEAGVTRVAEPKPPVYPDVNPKTVKLYAIEHDALSYWKSPHRTNSNIYWFTREDAENALRGLTSSSTNESCNEIPMVYPAGRLSVVEVEVVGRDEMERLRPLDEKKKAMDQKYRKDKEEFEHFCRKSRDACSGIWEDWNALQDERTKAARVRRTRDEYLTICQGDAEVAAKFLAKAFTPEEIALSEKWSS